MTDPPPLLVKRQPSDGKESNRVFAPRRVHVRLVGQDGPWADLRYELWHDSTRLSPQDARTSEDGVVFQLVRAPVESVTLKVWFYDHEQPHQFVLAIGTLPPIEDPEGLLQRMRNIGAGCTTKVEPHHVMALQRVFELAETGVVDDAFRARVLEVHGG